MLEAYEGMKAGETEMPAVVPETSWLISARIVALYDAWGKKDKADQWRKRLAEAAETSSSQR